MLVSIKNNNTRVYRENFKGNLIEIPAGEHVSMDRREAIEFIGKIPGTDPDTNMPFPKKLQLVPYIEQKVEVTQEPIIEITCDKCGKVCATEFGLTVHQRKCKS